MIFLKEEYLGKAKKLVEAEKILTEMSTDGLMDGSKIMDNPNKINKIEKLFSQHFNAQEFIIDFDTSQPMGAFTIPIRPHIFNLLEEDGLTVMKKNNRYFWKKGEGKIVYIMMSPVMAELLTPAETMGVLLHEVGHNFYQNGMLSIIFSIVYTPVLLLFTIGYKGLGKIKKHFRDEKKWRFVMKVLYTLSKFYLVVSRVLGPLGKISMFIAATAQNIIDFISTQTNSIVNLIFMEGFSNEKFSDNFATIHGYGPGLASGLSKLEHEGDSIYVKFDHKDVTGGQQSFWFAKSINLVGALATFCIAPFDEHPAIFQRVKAQRQLLEKEIKKIKNPRAKKHLMKDLDELKKIERMADDMKFDATIGAESTLDYIKQIFSLPSGQDIDALDKNAIKEEVERLTKGLDKETIFLN